MDLEDVWRLREEDVYPGLFGTVGRGIFTLTQELFDRQFGQRDVDPRWLFHGIFEFPPTPDRQSWIYVTSGYSNPWEVDEQDYDPVGISGAGVEFIMAVTQQGDWAIQTLQSILAFDLLLGAGRFANGRCLEFQDRIPLRRPINGSPDCEVRNLVVSEREEGAPHFQLPSGKVTFMAFTGVTDNELVFAKEHGSPALLERLRAIGAHPITDPHRRSAI